MYLSVTWPDFAIFIENGGLWIKVHMQITMSCDPCCFILFKNGGNMDMLIVQVLTSCAWRGVDYPCEMNVIPHCGVATRWCLIGQSVQGGVGLTTVAVTMRPLCVNEPQF